MNLAFTGSPYQQLRLYNTTLATSAKNRVLSIVRANDILLYNRGCFNGRAVMKKRYNRIDARASACAFRSDLLTNHSAF